MKNPTRHLYATLATWALVTSGLLCGANIRAAEVNLNATDVPLAIRDGSTITSTLSVASTTRIQDLNVILNVAHSFTGDLDISLTHSPSGITASLVRQAGLGSDNFPDVTFDDEASRPIQTAVGPFSGAYRPNEALSRFDGLTVGGTWVLTIADRNFLDVGTLLSWGLRATVNTPIEILRQPVAQQVPVGGRAAFLVEIADNPEAGPISFQWLFNGVPIRGATDAAMELLDVRDRDAGTYQVRVTAGTLEVLSAAVQLEVTPLQLTLYPAMEVVFPTSNGVRYIVQISDDLQTWADLGDVFTGNGQVMSRLYRTTDRAQRFFRVVERP